MQRTVILSPDERAQLEQITKSDPKPYRRERAAAFLKIAAGEIAAQVARTGLLRRRKPETVYRWLDRFEQEGLAGLTLQPGRGRKPALFPLSTEREAAQEGLRHLLHSSPHEFRRLLTQPTNHWTLRAVRAVRHAVLWLSYYSLSGIWRLLASLDIHWQRGRDPVPGPDPPYHARLAYPAACRQAVAQDPPRHVLL